jgi:hypothetical protein
MKRLVLSIIVGLGVTSTAYAKKTCEGIFPKNNAWIGVGFTDQGITEQAFYTVLDKLVAIYNPIVKSHGFNLQFNRLWSDGTVNSDTDTEGDNWVVNSYGGLARYNGMTSDGYAGVACHELGHHLGGAPLFSDGSDMSVEGEADYHVGKCLHKFFSPDNNTALMNGKTIDPLVVTRCSVAYAGNQEEIAICERSAIAGYAIAAILQDLEGDPKIAFDTPDTTVVKSTNEDHPAAQCRLDTYFESAVCPAVASDVEFSNTDASVGACMTGDGARSSCWFRN